MTRQPPTPPSSAETAGAAETQHWNEGELVVDLAHSGAVEALFATWGVEVVDKEVSPALALAVVRFDAAKADAAVAAHEVLTGVEQPPASPTDRLALAVRITCSTLYGGWEPILGKNRILSQVGGSRVLDIGSVPKRPARVLDIGSVKGSGSKKSAPQRVLDIGSRPLTIERVLDIGGQDEPVAVQSASWPPRTGEAGNRVRVAVVDTGVLPHPWLTGGYRCRTDDLVTPSPKLPEAAHHGTFVAGLVLSAAPACDLWLEKGLDAGGSKDSWELAKKLAEVAERGVDVVNLSLACFTEDDQPPMVLQRAVSCFGGQAVVVAAAGNYALDDGEQPRPSWPAALAGVVAVGSVDVDDDGDRLQDSTFSPKAPWVDVRAAGHQVTSTYGVDGSFRKWSGTSFAAATASGLIAAHTDPSEGAAATWRRIASGAVKVPGLWVEC